MSFDSTQMGETSTLMLFYKWILKFLYSVKLGLKKTNLWDGKNYHHRIVLRSSTELIYTDINFTCRENKWNNLTKLESMLKQSTKKLIPNLPLFLNRTCRGEVPMHFCRSEIYKL